VVDSATKNKLIVTPAHGADVNTWDQPLNANATAIDGMLGGVLILSLAAASTVLLTVPGTGSVAAQAGPWQSQNALIQFSGALSGNQIIQFSLPGFYIVQNLCTNNASFFVQLAPAAGTGAGNAVGAAPGQKITIFYDGTSVDYVDQPAVGSFMDLAVSTTPRWMTACSVSPWLICDGTQYNMSNFTALGLQLGSTFGGDGVTTFRVPDLNSRYRIPLDNQGATTAGRITNVISGISGTTWGASGGSQSMQAHTHVATDAGHNHTSNHNFSNIAATPPAASGATSFVGNTPDAGWNQTGFASITNATTGSGGSQNIPPGLVFGFSFIKT
jgi:microcystin-dependent protein